MGVCKKVYMYIFLILHEAKQSLNVIVASNSHGLCLDVLFYDIRYLCQNRRL